MLQVRLILWEVKESADLVTLIPLPVPWKELISSRLENLLQIENFDKGQLFNIKQRPPNFDSSTHILTQNLFFEIWFVFRL